MSLAVFGIILLLKPHSRARGQLFAAYVAIYSLERYVVEFWRVGASAAVFHPLAPLTQAQVASVVIGIIVAAYLLVDEWVRLHAAQQAPVPTPSDPKDAEAPRKPKKMHR